MGRDGRGGERKLREGKNGGREREGIREEVKGRSRGEGEGRGKKKRMVKEGRGN